MTRLIVRMIAVEMTMSLSYESCNGNRDSNHRESGYMYRKPAAKQKRGRVKIIRSLDPLRVM